MRRWQIGISTVLAAIVVVIAGSFTTPYGFALAGDASTQTAEAVKPLADSVQQIEKKLVQNEQANQQMLAVLNELRASSVANGIDRLIRRRCIETDGDELQALRRDIEQQKSIYYTLAKARYSEPSCDEVRR
jgi:hypothetical protein